MTILPLTDMSLSAIFGIGRRFYESTGLGGEFDVSRLSEWWHGLGTNAVGFYAQAPSGEVVGTVGGAVASDAFTRSLSLVEAFWYVAPEHRKSSAALRLLRAFEQEGKRRGARYCIMVALESSPEGVASAYRSRGYRPLEHIYRKNLWE